MKNDPIHDTINRDYYMACRSSCGGVRKIYKSFERPSKETMDILFGLIEDDENKSRMGEDNMETYYVVEVFDKYVDGFRKRCVDSDLSKVQVTTTKSLVDCYRFDTYEESKKFADKYNCTVRKVITKVEE